jgi:hypothetical protein
MPIYVLRANTVGQMEQFLADLFNVTMSVGSVSACERQTSAALDSPVAGAQAYVKDHQVKNAETLVDSGELLKRQLTGLHNGFS